MVSPLEKSGRIRLGSVLPHAEISALAAARKRLFTKRRRPPRRRTGRAIHRRAECLFAVQRPHAGRFCFQSVRGRPHCRGQNFQPGEASGAARARPGKPAAISLPPGRHCSREPKPSVEFLSGIKQAGFDLPEFAGLAGGKIASASPLTQRKLGRLRPWAWSPDSMELLAPLFANVTAEKRAAEKRFNDGLAELYSKTWSAEFLRGILCRRRRGDESQTSKTSQRLLTSSPTKDWLCTENEIGVGVNSLAEALAAVAKIRSRGHHKVVIKQALGLAGSNAMRLFEPEIMPAQKRWMENVFAHKRELVVEPWLERASFRRIV